LEHGEHDRGEYHEEDSSLDDDVEDPSLVGRNRSRRWKAPGDALARRPEFAGRQYITQLVHFQVVI
jgi:hypothetical protein